MSKAQQSSTALAYANALMQLAEERRDLQNVAGEMKSIGDALADLPQLRSFFNNPAITDADREIFLSRTLLPKTSSLVGSFLKLLSSRRQLGQLEAICDAFEKLMDDKLGKVEVDVTVSKKLSPQELEIVRQRISTAMKKEAVVHQYVDESILGGIVVRVGDSLIDGSVKAQLESIRTRMLNAKK